MTREELIRKVALKMDEISSSDDVIVSVGIEDNNPLYTQIDNFLNESVNDVLMKAPIYRLYDCLGTASAESDADFATGRVVAFFSVPRDFLRFVSIEDDLFQRPIVELSIEGDDVAKRQHNKFLVARKAKPVAVISTSDSAGRIITCYSYDKEDKPRPTMTYVRQYYGNDLLNEYLIDIVTWVCAGKVFAAQGDLNKGKLCDENAVSLMI